MHIPTAPCSYNVFEGDEAWAYDTGGPVVRGANTHMFSHGKNITFIPGTNGDLFSYFEGEIQKFPVSIWQLVEKSPFLAADGMCISCLLYLLVKI